MHENIMLSLKIHFSILLSGSKIYPTREAITPNKMVMLSAYKVAECSQSSAKMS
jgi:hypothetical protein